jgi:hypothetical protein
MKMARYFDHGAIWALAIRHAAASILPQPCLVDPLTIGLDAAQALMMRDWRASQTP